MNTLSAAPLLLAAAAMVGCAADTRSNDPDAVESDLPDSMTPCTLATPICRVEGVVSTCEKALAEVAASESGGGSLRSRCTEWCATSPTGMLDNDWLLWDRKIVDGTSCGVRVTVAGFPCDACCLLPDTAVLEVYCEETPCKSDLCAG